MKRFILALCACFVLFSCTKDDTTSPLPEITGFMIDGWRNGFDYDIEGVVDNTALTITLDRDLPSDSRIISRITAIGAVYYRGELCGESVTLDFSAEVKLVVLGYNGAKAVYTVIPLGGQEEGSNDNLITSFTLDLRQNGANTTYAGTINNTAGTIKFSPTLAWIENITSAKAVFAHEGKIVTVEGISQTSGKTANDFSRDVEYVVTSESGKKRTYKVSLSSPQATGLPVVRVVTQGGKDITSKTTYVTATVSLDNYANHGYDIAAAPAGIRGRGNSTWHYSKKPYRIRFDDKTAVLGHVKARSWVLLANWLDQTFLMNTVAFEIGHRIDFPYTNHPEHVELYINGSYKGSYVLTEQIQANPGRVEIDETNDYLLELDSYYDDEYKFRSAGISMPVNIKSPDLAEAASPSVVIAGIKADYEKMENAVMARSGWRDYMDEASFIDFMLINEITLNAELGHPKSTYLWKRTNGGKWTWGPLWDFDWGYGSPYEYWGRTTNRLFTGGYTGSDTGFKFFNRLMDDAQFRKRYKERWNEIKPLISDISVFVGEMGARLELSSTQNKRVWGDQYNRTYSKQITYMQDWLNQRIAYLDGVINTY